MATKRDAMIYTLVVEDGSQSQTAIAKQFGISQPAVSGICKKVAREIAERGGLFIEAETSYPHSQGGFWASDEQNAHIETMTARHGSKSEAMRQIINRSMSLETTNTTK